MIERRVRVFIEDPRSDDFGELALAAFDWQCERSEPLRRWRDRQGIGPGGPGDWQRLPLVPTRSFKGVALGTAEPEAVFHSSGTTQPERSVHAHGFLDLYRAVIDATFPAACLPVPPPVPMLSLVPSRERAPDSSLSFLIGHVLERYGADSSRTAFGQRGLEIVPARSWLGSAQRHGRPVVLLATTFSLAQLLEVLERRDLRFRLPPGSVLFETGGSKGKMRELAREELLERARERLALPPERVVREYGMTELTSHFYTRAREDGDPDLFVPPHWTRVRALDPETLEALPAGEVGLLAVLDLANLSTAVHVLTEDLGAIEAGGFRLAGRAAGAELRGCSLAAEEIATAAR